MNLYHQKAIELKYQKVKYIDIWKAIGKKISPSQLKHLFEVGGVLYFPYLDYEAKMNKVRFEALADQFKKDALVAPLIMTSLLQLAIKKKDYKTAFEILKEQMDRAGFVVVRKTKFDGESDSRKPRTYAEFRAECEQQGIDPDTGLRRRAEVEKNK